jgi:hypothetical protein
MNRSELLIMLPDSVKCARSLDLEASLGVTNVVLNAVIIIVLIILLILLCKLNGKKSILIPDYACSDRSYNDLLFDIRWYKKRAIILARDKNQCQHCGSCDNLRIHHKYYSKYPDETKVYPWNYPDDALITLCDSCHKKVHERKKIKVYYRKYDN